MTSAVNRGRPSVATFLTSQFTLLHNVQANSTFPHQSFETLVSHDYHGSKRASLIKNKILIG